MKIREITLFIFIVFAIIIVFSFGRITKPDSSVLSSSANSQDDTILKQDDPIEVSSNPQNTKVPKKNNFIFPDDKTEEKTIQRQFLQLDHETRMVIYYIQNGELEKILNEYEENIEVDEDGRLIFEEMDIPELAITSNLPKGTPLQLINGYTEDDYFNFHYYYNPIEADRAIALFVQYKRENDNWRLINIRTNH